MQSQAVRLHRSGKGLETACSAPVTLGWAAGPRLVPKGGEQRVQLRRAQAAARQRQQRLQQGVRAQALRRPPRRHHAQQLGQQRLRERARLRARARRQARQTAPPVQQRTSLLSTLACLTAQVSEA